MSGSVVTADGTEFSIEAEASRDEPTVYRLVRLDAGKTKEVVDNVYDDLTDMEEAHRLLAKRVEEWEAGASKKPPKPGRRPRKRTKVVS